jgi:predicted porin
MGLSAKVQYSANEFESDNGVLSPQMYGAALNFDWGPLSVLAAFEFHEDAYALALANPAAVGSAPRQAAFGSTAANSSAISSKDWAWRVGAGYQIVTPAGATTVGALFEQLTLGQETAAAGAVTEFKRWAAQGSLKHRITDHELRARFNVADAGDCTLAGGGACSTDGYDAQMLSVGYAYHFAPSTQAYVSFTKIWNEQNAQYTFSIGGAPAVAGATRRNGDPQALGVGIRHAL